MRTNRLFWGVVLVVLGGLLLLQSLGIIEWNVWLIFWPSLLILAGAWILLRPVRKTEVSETEALSVPIQSALEAAIDIKHSAGVLNINAGTNPSNLMEGTFAGGVEHRVDYSASWASLYLSIPSNIIFNFPESMRPDGLRWDMRLNDRIPLDIRLQTGAGENRIDFSQLLVRKMALETGASASNIILPAKAGFTQVDVHAGAASVVLRVPQGVAARIRMKSGLVGVNIDDNRFPVKGDIRESPDYDTAENRVEIQVEAGVGSIEIRSA